MGSISPRDRGFWTLCSPLQNRVQRRLAVLRDHRASRDDRDKPVFKALGRGRSTAPARHLQTRRVPTWARGPPWVLDIVRAGYKIEFVRRRLPRSPRQAGSRSSRTRWGSEIAGPARHLRTNGFPSDRVRGFWTLCGPVTKSSLQGTRHPEITSSWFRRRRTSVRRWRRRSRPCSSNRQLTWQPAGRAAAFTVPPSFSLRRKGAPGAPFWTWSRATSTSSSRATSGWRRWPLSCPHYFWEVGPPPSTFGTRISTFRFTQTTRSFSRSISGMWTSTASPSTTWFDGQSGGGASAMQIADAPNSVLRRYHPSVDRLQKHLRVSAAVLQAIGWWTEEHYVLQGRRSHDTLPLTDITTDASLLGWGASHETRTASGRWRIPACTSTVSSWRRSGGHWTSGWRRATRNEDGFRPVVGGGFFNWSWLEAVRRALDVVTGAQPDGDHRQHDGRSLHQPPGGGGYEVRDPLRSFGEPVDSVPGAGHPRAWSLGQHWVDLLFQLRQALCRPVRGLEEQTTPDLLRKEVSPAGLEDGLLLLRVGRPGALRLPFLVPSPEGPVQARHVQGCSDAAVRPMLADPDRGSPCFSNSPATVRRAFRATNRLLTQAGGWEWFREPDLRHLHLSSWQLTGDVSARQEFWRGLPSWWVAQDGLSQLGLTTPGSPRSTPGRQIMTAIPWMQPQRRSRSSSRPCSTRAASATPSGTTAQPSPRCTMGFRVALPWGTTRSLPSCSRACSNDDLPLDA